jgi:hypothetical protein
MLEKSFGPQTFNVLLDRLGGFAQRACHFPDGWGDSMLGIVFFYEIQNRLLFISQFHSNLRPKGLSIKTIVSIDICLVLSSLFCYHRGAPHDGRAIYQEEENYMVAPTIRPRKSSGIQRYPIPRRIKKRFAGAT